MYAGDKELKHHFKQILFAPKPNEINQFYHRHFWKSRISAVVSASIQPLHFFVLEIDIA
jgi:hypothetical protein